MEKDRRKKRICTHQFVLVAMLSALCVVCNEICVHTLPLHAGTAIVIIAGLTLGKKSGFVVGCLSRFICNIFDGQGAWTLWQMIAWGLLGVVAGAVFYQAERRKNWEPNPQFLSKKNFLGQWQEGGILPVICVLFAWLIAYIVCLLRFNSANFIGWRLYFYGAIGWIAGFLLNRKKLPVTPFTMAMVTFFSVFFLYGGIMNLGTLFFQAMVHQTTKSVNMENLKLLYLSGAPYDFLHAICAAICIFLFGDSMVQKIVRIQTKFGW